MNKKHYQIFSLLLSIFLCFSNLTTSILAEGEEDSEQTPEEILEVVVEEQPEEPEEQEEQEEEVTEETEDPESELAEEISEESSESEDVPVDEDVSVEVITPAEEEESDSEMLEDGEDPEETEISEVTEPEETEEPSELFGDVNVIADGDVSDTITWMLTDDMTLYLSGSGACPDYDPLNNQHNEEATYVPWKEYEQQIVKVVVENGITSVGEYTFYKNNALAEVILPNSVVSIGGYAFCIDKALTDITFPSQLETIGKFAFKRCAFTEINLPDSVTLIDEYAFDGVKLDSVIMPKNLMSIGAGAFGECGLTSVVLNDKLRTIGDKAFILNKLSNIVIPQRVEEIGINPFTNNPLETIIVVSGNYYYYTKDNVLFSYEKKLIAYPANKTDSEWTIPNGIETIGNSAFFLASNLETIHLPANLKTIEHSAFNQSGLTSITIPSKVSEIGNSVFYSCTNLTEVKFNGNSLAKISQSTFDSCTSLREIYLPDSVSEISINAFYNCKSLERIQFSRKMKTIGMSAFSSCRSLSTVIFRGRESDWNKIKISSGNTPLTSTETERIYVVPVESIKVEKEEIHFDEVGMQRQLSYTVEPSDAYNTNVSFVDYDSRVINISDTGLITAVGEGITIGTVVTEDGGFQDTFLVTVGEYSYVEAELREHISPKNKAKNVRVLSKDECGVIKGDLTIALRLFPDPHMLYFEEGFLYIQTESNKTIDCTEMNVTYSIDNSIILINLNDIYGINPGEQITVVINGGLFDKYNEATKYVAVDKCTFTVNRFIQGIDSNGHRNKPEAFDVYDRYYRVDDPWLTKLYDLERVAPSGVFWKAGLWDNLNHYHKGVCYGIVMIETLLYNGIISISDISDSDAKVYYELDPMNDKKYTNSVKFYEDLEFINSFDSDKICLSKIYKEQDQIYWWGFCNTVLSHIQNGEVVPLKYRIEEGSHMVLAYAWEYDPVGQEYVVFISDPNGIITKDTRLPAEGKLHFSEDCSTVNYHDSTATISKIQYMYAIDIDKFVDTLNLDSTLVSHGGKGRTLLSREKDLSLSVLDSDAGSTSVLVDNIIDDSFGKLLNSVAGDSTISYMNKYYIYNTDDWSLTTPNNKYDLYVYDDSNYVQVVVDGADEIILHMDEALVLEIKGDLYSFSVGVGESTVCGDNIDAVLSLSGTANDNLKIEKETNGINIQSRKNITELKSKLITDINTSSEIEHEDTCSLNMTIFGQFDIGMSDLELLKGDEYKIPVISIPTGYTESDIVWSADNSDLIEVSEDGTIHAIETGTAYITAIIEELNVSTKVKVNVHPSEIHIKNIAAQKYTGAVIKPELSVYDGANKLTAGTDYTVTYKNNKNAYTLKEGDAGFSAKKAPQATIKGNGNYSSTKTVYFTIDPVDFTTDEAETLTTAYTGKVQKLSPVVKYKGKTLKKGTDYIVTYPGEGYKEPGIYEITVTGKGNYIGTRTYQMVIGSKDQINLSKATVTTEKKSYAYDEGNQITPNITVKSGKKVVDPSFYTVTYGENNTTGKGTVTITGNDQETIGTKTITFTITGKPINKLVKVSAPKSVARGTALTDSVTISTELTEGTDYTVQYPETVNAGKVKVVITGIGGYIGTVSKTVTVNPDKLTAENTEVIAADAEQMKNGARPEVSVVVNEELLEAGTDYTVSYSNNKKAGTGTVTVKGKGNYSGTLKTSFTITPKDLERTTIDYVNQANSSTKKGSYKTTVVVKDEDGGQLKAGTDYTLKFFDGETEIPASAKANDYLDKPLTVKIFGKGSYTGCIEGTYTVAANNTNLSKAVIKIRNQKYLSGAPVEITGQEQFSKAVMGKTPLTLGEDFAVYEYSNNVNKGTATVIFQGIGSYSGYKKVTYKIRQRSIKEYWGGVVSFLSRLMN